MVVLIYLHGFLSAPESTKAVLTKNWLLQNRPDVKYLCPRLSPYPSKAKDTLVKLMSEYSDAKPVLVGSSLGGYWATWLAETYDLPAVLVNPAVKPSMFLPEYLGVELKNYYSDETYVLDDDDVKSLSEVNVARIEKPENYWLMVQTGDDTLDYQLATKKYLGCRQLVEMGGNHSFENYESWIPVVLKFLEERRSELVS